MFYCVFVFVLSIFFIFFADLLEKELDIVFALGASDPNGARIFEQEKALALSLMSQQKGIPTRYSVVTYSSTSTTEMSMQPSVDTYRLKENVRSLKWPGSGSGVHSALTQVKSIFDQSKPGSQKAFVLFMNGEASAPLATIRELIQPLINQGVRIVVVGYGDQLNYDELLAIAKNPKNIITPSTDKDNDTYRISLAFLKSK